MQAFVYAAKYVWIRNRPNKLLESSFICFLAQTAQPAWDKSH